MIRGTTPTLEFALPFDVDMIENGYVTLSQNGEETINKQLSDCVMEGRKVSVTLTQADTLKLDDKVNVEIQLRVRTVTGDVLASDIYCTDVGRILKGGEI